MLKAVTRSAQLVDQKLAQLNGQRAANDQTLLSVANYFDHHAIDTDLQVAVVEDDFTKARDELTPSVSVDELRHYEKVRDAFEGANKQSRPEIEDAKSRPSAGQVNGDASSRPKLNDLMKRASLHGQKTSNANGSKKVNGLAGQVDGASDGDEDFVIKTDRLSLGAGIRPPSSKGKGKSKSHEVSNGIGGQRANESEDLYD